MSLAKRARERAGLTQVQLARVLGVSRVSIIRWENGGAVPGPVRAILLLLEAMPERTLQVLSDGARVPASDSDGERPLPATQAGDNGRVVESASPHEPAPAPSPRTEEPPPSSSTS